MAVEFPKVVPSPATVVAKIREHGGVQLAENAGWGDVWRVMDENQSLYRDCSLVGEFEKLGITVPFSLCNGPVEITQRLDRLRQVIIEKEPQSLLPDRRIRCEAAVAAIEEYDYREGSPKELCIFREVPGEVEEYTAQESFLKCFTGEEPGSCSETTYRYAAALLYLNTDCDIRAGHWPQHVALMAGNVEDGGYMAVNMMRYGPPESFMSPSLIVADYYINVFGREALRFWGDEDGAIESFRVLLKIFPNNDFVRERVAQAFIESVKDEFVEVEVVDEGKSIFQDLIARGVATSTSYRVFGEISLFRSRNLEDAALFLNRAMFLNPWYYGSYDLMSIVASEHYQLSLSGGFLSAAERLTPSNISEKEEIGTALTKLREALPLDIADVEARIKGSGYPEDSVEVAVELIRLGDYYHALGDVQKASECYFRIMAMSAVSPEQKIEVIELLDAVMRKLKKTTEWAQYLEKYIQENPDSFTAIMILADLYVEQREDEKAKEIYSRLMASGNPVLRSFAHVGMSYIYADQSDYRSALSECRTAVQLDESSFVGHLCMTQGLTAMGEFELAEQHLKKAREIDPFNPAAFSVAAAIYLNKVDLVRALMWADLAFRVQGDDFDDWGLLGFISFYKGDYEAAAAYFLKDIELHPGAGSFNSKAALAVLLYMYDNPAYQKLYDEVIKEPRDEMYHFMLGMMRGFSAMDEGNSEELRVQYREEAISYFEKALEIRPGFAFARATLEELQAMVPLHEEVFSPRHQCVMGE